MEKRAGPPKSRSGLPGMQQNVPIIISLLVGASIVGPTAVGTSTLVMGD